MFNRSIRRARCVSIVLTLTSRMPAISLVDRPAAINCRISRWRCVNPSSGSISATAPELRIDLVRNEPRIDLVLSWSPVEAAAGYHVLQSVDPAFGSGVELIGNPTTETILTLDDGARTTPALTFFLVRAVNSCHHEGP